MLRRGRRTASPFSFLAPARRAPVPSAGGRVPGPSSFSPGQYGNSRNPNAGRAVGVGETLERDQEPLPSGGRNFMKPIAITLLMLASVAPSGLSADVVREQSRKSVDATGLREVVVRNARGTVDVRPSTDGQIHIAALKVIRASGRTSAAELARESRVELSRDGTAYLIQVRYPRSRHVQIDIWKGFDDSMIPRIDVELTVEIPAQLLLSVDGSRVDVTTTDLAAGQSLDTASGDVHIESAR